MTSLNTIAPENQRKTRGTSFEPDVAIAVGRAVRARREALGLAQDKFSYKAHIDRSYFGKLERGERQPTVGLLLKIAGALDCTGAELLAEAEKLLLKKQQPAKRSA